LGPLELWHHEVREVRVVLRCHTAACK
jgi:hypothetical protein